MGSMSRNVAIDLWRIIFVSLIVLAHTVFLVSKNEASICRGGYIGVEFFFVVSGYLMTASAEKATANQENQIKPGHSVFDIMRRKIKGIYPDFMCACIIAFIVRQFVLKADFTAVLENAAQSIWVPLLTYSTGVEHFAILGQSWYLSSMFLIMPVLLYFLIRNGGCFFRKIAAPLIWVFILGYLSKHVGNINVTGGIKGGFAYGSLLRAAMGLCGGCISYSIAKYFSKREYTTVGRIVLTLLELCGYFAIIICSFFINRTYYDFLFALLMVISVSITFSGQSYIAEFLNKKWKGADSAKIVRYGLCIYLYNNIFHYISWKVSLNVIFPYYLIYSYLAPLVFMLVVDFVKKLFRKGKCILVEQQ